MNALKGLFGFGICLIFIGFSAAHPGRTDSSGGHTDKSTGSYHYHGGSAAPSAPKPAAPSPTTAPRPVPTYYYAPPKPYTPPKPPAEKQTATKRAPLGFPELIAELISPENLSTLGERGANPRIQKAVALMSMAADVNLNLTNVVRQAVEIAGYTNAAAELTRNALLKNYQIAAQYGVLTDAGLAEMKRGRSATIPSSGDELSVDHIVPRSKFPQLDNVIANLELMPLRANVSKNDSFGPRQQEMLKRFKDAHLIK